MVRLIRLLTLGGAGFALGALVILSLTKVFSAIGPTREKTAEIYSPSVTPPPPSQTPMPATPSATHKPSPTHIPTPFPTPSATQIPVPSPTSQPITAEQLDAWFTGYSSYYSVDRQLLWNIAVCESKLNQKAVNGDYVGLYQFSSRTWVTTRSIMNADTNPQLRLSAEESIRTAAFKLSTQGSASWPNCK